jgi:two-component system cell cycle sensor histidine kinase/response regulator CckA
MRRYADADRIEDLEVDWMRKDGRLVRVQLNGRPIRDAAGRVGAYEMIVEDVTERRILERQLRQSQKMEAIGQLTGGVAHDFNNLLTTVLANADLLTKTLVGHPEVLGDVGEIRMAATRGAELVRKLLAFSRREMLDLQPLHLSGVVREASEILRRVLPESIEIQVMGDPEAGPALVDRAAVLQIIMNLATNARDAMPEGGVLRLATVSIAVDEAQCAEWGWGTPGDYVCLEVQDSGLGMDEATRARIFEPFFTTKPVGKGSGLGLAMVYGLVKQHRGYVAVQSRPGQGTTCRIYFPRADVEAGTSGAGTVTPGVRLRGGSETILVVEDEESIRRSATRVLERFGYRVLTAADGLEALTVLAREGAAIDLVVTDVVMPRLNGPKLYEQVCRQAHVPRFLFMSGYAERDVHGGALDATVPFLQKPWQLDALVAEVRAVLDRAPPSGESPAAP